MENLYFDIRDMRLKFGTLTNSRRWVIEAASKEKEAADKDVVAKQERQAGYSNAFLFFPN